MENEKVKKDSIYIRLSAESKTRLKAAAKAAGYTLSAFVRLTLAQAAETALTAEKASKK